MKLRAWLEICRGWWRCLNLFKNLYFCFCFCCRFALVMGMVKKSSFKTHQGKVSIGVECREVPCLVAKRRSIYSTTIGRVHKVRLFRLLCVLFMTGSGLSLIVRGAALFGWDGCPCTHCFSTRWGDIFRVPLRLMSYGSDLGVLQLGVLFRDDMYTHPVIEDLYTHAYYLNASVENNRTAKDALKVTENLVRRPARRYLRRTPFDVVDDSEALELLDQVRQNGSMLCHQTKTRGAYVLGLPAPVNLGQTIRLQAGEVHSLVIVSMGSNGRPRCAGGDYYEIDITGDYWKSRPTTIDRGDGTYEVNLLVHPQFVGTYIFNVVLLFANFHGLHLLPMSVNPFHVPNPWFRNQSITSLEIEFVRAEPPWHPRPSIHSFVDDSPRKELKMCTPHDFAVSNWNGRWTRDVYNQSCQIDQNGRFLCLSPEYECERPWCEGPLGRLESNGWVYSAHCSFKLFTENEAWQCLDKKWIFLWGDSTNQDSSRNLLNLVLGIPSVVGRRSDRVYQRPSNRTQSVRVTNIFNGHSNDTMNYQGLESLSSPKFQNLLRSFFTNKSSPDFMVMNSGLHDSCYFKELQGFADAVDFANTFWESVLHSILPKSPFFIYRTTVTTAADDRAKNFNPQKMEMFNKLYADKLIRNSKIPHLRIVDYFDMTFPWHWDLECSDGRHYGRAPSLTQWRNGKMGHQYFVDVMLAHILLNAMCV